MKIYNANKVTAQQLTDQYTENPETVRKLAVQEVVDRIMKYKGVYLKQLLELNDQYGLESNIRDGGTISSTAGFKRASSILHVI